MEWNPEVHAEEAIPRPAQAVAQIDQPCFVRLQRGSLGLRVDRIKSISVIIQTFSPRTWNDLKVNIPEVNSNYEYVTELRERLEIR